MGEVIKNENVSGAYQIYEIDGIHGTLKELSDYFGADPVAVSDLLLEGMDFTDAVLTASSKQGLKVPKKPELDEPEVVKNEVKKENKKEIEKMESEVRVPEVRKVEEQLVQSNPFISSAEVVVRPEVPVQSVEQFVSQAGSNVCPANLNSFVANSGAMQPDVNTSTHVQHVGDFIIVTTTTTTVIKVR